MRIISREEFMKLSAGTVYHKYDPYCFEGLFIKDETICSEGENIDWFETQLDIPYFAYCSASNSDAHDNMLGGSVENATYSSGRDGLFEYDQLFAVLCKNEVESLISLLNAAIATAYKQT